MIFELVVLKAFPLHVHVFNAFALMLWLVSTQVCVSESKILQLPREQFHKMKTIHHEI